MNRVITRARRGKQFGTVTGWSEDKSLMPSWRGQLSLVPVNAQAAGSMPLGPPQRMHGSRSAWWRSWPRVRREWRIGVCLLPTDVCVSASVRNYSLTLSLMSWWCCVAIKTGQCPMVQDAYITGPCTVQCTADSHCVGDQKCCLMGCNRTCQQPGKPVHCVL